MVTVSKCLSLVTASCLVLLDPSLADLGRRGAPRPLGDVLLVIVFLEDVIPLELGVEQEFDDELRAGHQLNLGVVGVHDVRISLSSKAYR